MLRATGGRINLDIPVARDLNGHVRGRPEAIEGKLAAALHSGEPKRAKTDDPRAQKGSGLLVVKRLGDRVDESFWRDSVFGIASVDRIAGKSGAVAEIFLARAAILARLIRAVQPRNADARAEREAAGALAKFLDNPDHLVPGDYGRFARRELPFNHMQIGAAYPASVHAHEHFAWPRIGAGHVKESERVGIDRRGRTQKAGLHLFTTLLVKTIVPEQVRSAQ